MSGVYYQTVTAEEMGQRLDNFLIRILKGVPKSHVYRLIRGGEVRVNKGRAKPSRRLEAGDVIRIPPVRVSSEPPVSYVGRDTEGLLSASIMHEDAELIVMNKPSGIAVHGGSGVSLGVIEALRQMRPELAYLELVHRLDKETSGCLLLAKKRSVLRAIQAAFTAKTVTKEYWALLMDRWENQATCMVKAPLQKNTLQSGERMVRVDANGKPSQTSFCLIENFSDACWVRVTPKTGRTHQIRVHSASIGHPVLGDEKYGGESMRQRMGSLPSRLYLHARSIQFNLNEVTYHFQADADEKFMRGVASLRQIEE